MEAVVTQMVSHFEEVIMQLRHMLPKNTATAQAIDRHESWERIAMKAIGDGYVESADRLVRSVEMCLRRSA